MLHQNTKNFNILKLASLSAVLMFLAVGCTKQSDDQSDKTDTSAKKDRSFDTDSKDSSPQKPDIKSIAGKKYTPSVAVGSAAYYFCGEKGASSGTFVDDSQGLVRRFKTGTWKIVGDKVTVNYTFLNMEKGVGNFRVSTHGFEYSKFGGYSEKIAEKAEFTEDTLFNLSVYDIEGGCPTYSPVNKISFKQSKLDMNEAAGKLYLLKSDRDENKSAAHNELYLCGEKGASSGAAVHDIQFDFETPRKHRTGTWKLNGNSVEVSFSVLRTAKSPLGSEETQKEPVVKKNISEKEEFTEETLRTAIVFDYKEACPVFKIPKVE